MKGCECMDSIDLDAEKLVIDNNSKYRKYTHEEKVKYLEDAIRNGGYYGDDGTWNSIVVFSGDNHVYRVRVETLILNGDSIFLKFYPKDNKKIYTIPGGSIEKDISNIDQAVNECKEEARIVVKNIQSTGVTYKEIMSPPKWAVTSQPVNWNGNYTEVYVAEYDKKFNGHIDKVDEDKFMMTGKFYNIHKVYPYLRKEHKKALKAVYPFKFDSIKEESCKIDKKSLLDNVLNALTNNGFTPRVSRQSRNAFINNKNHLLSDGSTICISGFAQKDVKKASKLVNDMFKDSGVQCTPDNYGTIFLSIGSDILTEKALTTEERNSLDYSQFGIPSIRKFPLHDKAHVITAIRYFNTVGRKYEKELAYNLIKAMNRYGIDKSIVGDNNRLKTYIE
jgi:hypothetical protein